MISLTIDGRRVHAPDGTNVVDAAHLAGIEIPVFCHHPKLEPVGMCRMCLVEAGTPSIDRATGEIQLGDDGEPIIRMFPSLVAACTTPVSEGMVVSTESDAVSEARRGVLELLLTSHPLDCPICDKGGECPLQNQTMRFGPGQSRFVWGDKYRFPKPLPLGPLVALDRERCVLCARCIRFQDEVAGDGVLGFENRGRGMEIISYSDPPFDSRFSLNTTDICPVGALTSVAFRFEARAWELVGRPGVCSQCAVGCNVMSDTRHGQVVRVMPRENDRVNELWLCDKGRLAHHTGLSDDRVTTPLVNRDGELVPATWDEALSVVVDRLDVVTATHGAQSVGGLAGPTESNEDLYAFGRFLRSVVGTNNVDHSGSVVRDDVLTRLGAGVHDPEATDPIGLTDAGKGTTVLVVGLDVAEEAPVLYLNLRRAHRRGARVIVVAGRPQKADELAAVCVRWRYGRERAALASLSGAAEGTAAESAAESITTAEDLLILYGQEACEAGLVDGLAAIAGANGRAGQCRNGLVAVGRHANAQGAADMGLLPGWLPGYGAIHDDEAVRRMSEVWPNPPPVDPGKAAPDMLSGGVRALFVLGSDLAAGGQHIVDNLGALDLLVVLDAFLTSTARQAHVVLPTSLPGETDGTFTNALRRVQRFVAASRTAAEARAPWLVLNDLGRRLGYPVPFGSVSDVFDEMARVARPYGRISHADLGPDQETQPADIMLPVAPQTAARHVSYQGTAYSTPVTNGAVWTCPDSASTLVEPASLPPEEPEEPEGAGDLLIVPAPLLYDAGRAMSSTPALTPLIPEPYIEMNANDAESRGLVDGDRVVVETAHASVEADLRVVVGVTPGVVHAPIGLAWQTPLPSLLGESRFVAVDVGAVKE